MRRNKKKYCHCWSVFSVTCKYEKMLFALWSSIELLLFFKTSWKYPRKVLCKTFQVRMLKCHFQQFLKFYCLYCYGIWLQLIVIVCTGASSPPQKYQTPLSCQGPLKSANCASPSYLGNPPSPPASLYFFSLELPFLNVGFFSECTRY